MIRDPKDLSRYTASQRANHWVIGICFILLSASGLSFFHPAFFPLTQLFGGPVWARILHPYIGVIIGAALVPMFFRFWKLNILTRTDIEWLMRVREMIDGNDHDMPEQGKYNGGQKLVFWGMSACILALLASGLVMWRGYFTFPVGIVRVAVVVHAAAAIAMLLTAFVHVYAAIWTKGTIRAMWYGTVTRAWAKQHHRAWYRQATGK
ncbi:MAG: formate dehydrogenase subunit gamma [Candidatus Accumulibacter sp.]|jgi:formate dehydrogenase subunit gamma|nr:formate dehydrogenase subunit gamma [Accumulibacter sp.]